MTGPLRLVVLSGGTSDPSSTRMLADRLAQRAAAALHEAGRQVTVDVVEVRPLAAEIAAGQATGFAAGRVRAAVDAIAGADGLIVATPVYTAGVSGLVKSFIDLLDTDAVLAVPTLLAATAGSARHALVADGELRSLFAYLRALTVPTSVFAAGDDWGSTALTERIDRAANELAVLMDSGVRDRMRSASWHSYQHTFGSAAAGDEVVLDSDLMRLATGGA